jgi:hypothetical protein
MIDIAADANKPATNARARPLLALTRLAIMVVTVTLRTNPISAEIDSHMYASTSPRQRNVSTAFRFQTPVKRADHVNQRVFEILATQVERCANNLSIPERPPHVLHALLV